MIVFIEFPSNGHDDFMKYVRLWSKWNQPFISDPLAVIIYFLFLDVKSPNTFA